MKDSFPVVQWCILSLVPSLRLPSVRIASSSNNPAERIISRWDEGWRSVRKRTASWRSQPWNFWAAWRWRPKRGGAAGRMDFTAPCSGFGPFFSIFTPVGWSGSDLYVIVSQLQKPKSDRGFNMLFNAGEDEACTSATRRDDWPTSQLRPQHWSVGRLPVLRST